MTQIKACPNCGCTKPHEVVTLSGSSIPTRLLTEEEKSRDITGERFQEYHNEVGEDFLDQTNEGDPKVFGGWLLGKLPEYNLEILEIINGKRPDMLGFIEIACLEWDNEKDTYPLYEYFAEFCNLTKSTKARVNEILIITAEYYSK